ASLAGRGGGGGVWRGVSLSLPPSRPPCPAPPLESPPSRNGRGMGSGKERGMVAPEGPGAANACSPHTNFSSPPPPTPWVALIQRGGGCTFAEKIAVAAAREASAAVIYNYAGGSGNDVHPMTHPGEENGGSMGVGGGGREGDGQFPGCAPRLGIGSL
uniref:PA domain-containing protein n=1 Tax=Podarcis muralis TaxID=64176 RepID=A0A670K1R2_PODMU